LFGLVVGFDVGLLVGSVVALGLLVGLDVGFVVGL